MLPDEVLSSRYGVKRITPYPKAVAQTTYFDTRSQRDAVKLLPGEYFCTNADPALVTVLGSCVAACIRDSVSGIGGMNHFMLAHNAKDNPAATSMIYGDIAMDVLIEQILEAGGKLNNLEAKVFGGAHMLNSMIANDIGERNGKFAVDYLRRRSIPVLAQDVGGMLARKLYFFPFTGQALVRKLADLANNTIMKRDRDYSTFVKPSLR